MKRRPKKNNRLLVDRLYESYIERVKPLEANARKTSLMQSQAAHFGRELIALSVGVGECEKHPDCVATVCPICDGLWLHKKRIGELET